MFIEAWDYLAGHQAQFLAALWRHVALSASALAIAAAIAVPLGVRLADSHRTALVAINAANIGRTLPSLAVLALVMPVMGTGFAPSLFALTLLALPPILINTYAAIRQVDPDIVDAARGMGMTQRQTFLRVELPLALPAILAGLRIATVSTISVATVASFVVAKGLGHPIFIALEQNIFKTEIFMAGGMAVALALAADGLLVLVQRVLTPWARLGRSA